MESFNQTYFLMLNASAHPDHSLVLIAKLLAEGLVWLIPLTLIGNWLSGQPARRRIAVIGAVAGLAALSLNQLIGLFWQHPRPFMIGLGHTLMPHAPDSSFPSDHLTLIWSVSLLFLAQAKTRVAGLLLTLMGIPVAWARIYLGVHFPLDMLGALLCGGLTAWAFHNVESPLATRLYRWAEQLYQLLCGPFIRRGWLPA
ncbi:MAG: phosphatase PAP2 family protein [Marinobacter sp.]|nr:phosphatase PAP2 family protein [Marinobacter sp.]